MEIAISNQQKILQIETGPITANARKILDALGYPEAQLSLVLVDDAEICRLNQEYLNRSGPTNVIAFPMQEGLFGEVNPDLLGDVVISVETARNQAVEGGYTIGEMLDFLLIHGILHLVGYDHEGDLQEAARMEAKTNELFLALGH